MDLIQDRANKFMNEVRKKKIKVGKSIYNKDQVKQDGLPLSDLSKCFYCEKVFYNGKYLMKHILRRHSEDLLVLYKKGLTAESIFNSDDMKHLHSYIESEFVSLKNELKVVKQAVVGKNVESDTEASKNNINVESQEDACNISENDIKISQDVTEILSNEIKDHAERLCELETNNQSLKNTFKELDNSLKTDVLWKQELKEHLDINNDKILRVQESQLHELRQILLKDLQTIMSKQLYDNNNELKSQLSEVKGKLRQIDCKIAATNERIDSPDFMKTVKEKYEHQLNVLIASMKKHNSRVHNRPKSKPEVNNTAREKISIHNKATKRLSRRKDKEVSVMQQTSPKELTYLVNEKLSYFGIAVGTSKMSNTEYAEKLKLINIQKECLKKTYPQFSEIYDGINMAANCKVKSKLRNKKSHKVKFSEPLKSTRSTVKNSLSNAEKIQNKQLTKTQHLTTVADSPELHDYHGDSAALQEHEYIPEKEGFLAPDLNGGGDCSRIYSCDPNHNFEELLTVVKPIFEFKNSPIDYNTQKSRKTENQTDSFEGPSYIESVSEFKNSSLVKSTEKSKKIENQTDSFEEASSASEFKNSSVVNSAQKTENQTDFSGEPPFSAKSVSDSKLSSSNDSWKSKKTESVDSSEDSYSLNSVPFCSKESFDCNPFEMQNSDYTLKDYYAKNLGEKENCNSNSDISDFGGSLKSLSSWED